MLPTGDAEGVRELLEHAEQQLADRVTLVAGLDISPLEVAAFAAERERLAEQWDELALVEDGAADARDDRAEDRDQQATDRERQPRLGIAGDDPGFAQRFLSAGDRDDAAADRLASRDDRRHAQAGRDRAAEARHLAADVQDLGQAAAPESRLAALQWTLSSRIQIGQATGLLMERYSMDADRAFRMLVHLAHESKVSVHEIAERVAVTSELRRSQQERGGRSVAVEGQTANTEEPTHID